MARVQTTVVFFRNRSHNGGSRRRMVEAGYSRSWAQSGEEGTKAVFTETAPIWGLAVVEAGIVASAHVDGACCPITTTGEKRFVMAEAGLEVVEAGFSQSQTVGVKASADLDGSVVVVVGVGGASLNSNHRNQQDGTDLRRSLRTRESADLKAPGQIRVRAVRKKQSTQTYYSMLSRAALRLGGKWGPKYVRGEAACSESCIYVRSGAACRSWLKSRAACGSNPLRWENRGRVTAALLLLKAGAR